MPLSMTGISPLVVAFSEAGAPPFLGLGGKPGSFDASTFGNG